MKKLIYIFLILLGFTSCMKEDIVKMEPNATDKVDIIFGVTLPEPPVDTKVMGTNPDVKSLRVAVFGGSGYLKEYVEATPVDLATTNNDRYTYKVTLSLTDSRVKVHFIANGPTTLPFKYEDEVMSTLTTAGTQDAYWQRMELPNGITAQKYPDYYPEDPDKAGEYIKDENDKYIVTDETKAYFQDVPLIRNFAKLQVTADPASTSNFELTSYAIVNVPTEGSVAVYNSNTGAFIMNYKDLSFAEVKAAYPGHFPATATIDKTIPAASAFSADPVYMYERPIPTADATFLIVYGRYTPTNTMCYYRIELQDADGYYAIYRNFVYTVNISKILKEGSATPTDAANSAGSGDVSTDHKAENLTDVSDGVARIFVEYTEKTLVGQGTVTLKFKFLPNASSSTPNNNAVTITVGDPGATGAVISGTPTVATSDDAQGWRQLTFTSTEPGDATKTQTIKVTGNYGSGSKLFRNVTYKLMKIQNMLVVCDPHDVLQGKGEEVDVLIKIPKDLPRSIFPLQLQIESSALSITPNNDNLPVQPGKSIINGTTSSYQFIKTLSYEKYLELQEASTDEWVTVPTHFKTSKDLSACDVYVANEYFITNHDSFINYTMKNFTNLQFSSNTLTEPDQPVTFTFNMVSGDIPSKVTLKLTGLKPAAGSTLVQVGTNTYEYTTTGTNVATISLLTSSDEGVYGAEISAPHYYTASIGNLSYNNPRFTSSAAAGRNKPINFAFGYQNGVVEPVTFTLTNLKPQATDTRFTEIGGGEWLFTPNGSDLNQTITFLTESWNDVSLTMSGPSYNSSAAVTSTAAATMTIEAQSIMFQNTQYYVRNATIRMYDTRTSTYTTFSTNNNEYNNADFTITRANLNSNLKVYFRWNSYNYYSTAISVYDLDEATTSSRLTVDLDNTSAPTL